MSDFTDNIQFAIDAVKQAETNAIDCFFAECRESFVRHPNIKNISWIQYTPYFNDGDPCNFTMGEIYISEHEDMIRCEWCSDEEEPDGIESVELYGKIKGKYADYQDLFNFLNSSFGRRLMENQYGTNVQIVITSEGINTSEHLPGY